MSDEELNAVVDMREAIDHALEVFQGFADDGCNVADVMDSLEQAKKAGEVFDVED